MKYFIVLMFFIKTMSVFGQDYILPNEILIFSFETQNAKKITLCKDKNEDYIIYRFGTKNKVEFEFPDKTKNSWKQFKYSFYLRGGGIENEGMDLNYVAFVNKNYKYVIYTTYVAVGRKMNVGIKIIDLLTNKVTDIKGIHRTRKGTLIDFRFNNLLEIDDELYE